MYMQQGLLFFLILITIVIISLILIFKMGKDRARLEIIAFSIMLVLTGFAVNELHDYKQLGDSFTLFQGLYFALGRLLLIIGFMVGLFGFFRRK